MLTTVVYLVTSREGITAVLQYKYRVMPRQRVMIPYPPDVIAEIDKIVSHGNRTAFLVELAKREIKLNRQRKALRAATGAWKAEEPP